MLKVVDDTILGCWLGKSIGGTLGLPAEGRPGPLAFSFYDPVPTVAPPNDDLELQLVWLELIERTTTGEVTPRQFAEGWLEHIHYMWSEYGRCRWNLRRGVPLDSVGTFENHFASSMGSPIRSEIWACIFPDDPDSAAHYAALDSSLDHGVEGVAGEVFFAVMQNKVASGAEVEEAISFALTYLPAGCETFRAIELARAEHRRGTEVWECWKKIVAQHAGENFTHAPLNIALTVWGLLYGEGDFERSIVLATNGGYDTDCTAATVGATLGLVIGAREIPERWQQPIGDGVYVGPGILGLSTPKTLGELTERTVALIGKLKPKKWSNDLWRRVPKKIDLNRLPGTIQITPLGAGRPVPWANGELPPEVKAAGGAEWIWHLDLPVAESREIVCLARGGAALYVDGQLVVDCAPGLPYVPKTHSCPHGSRNQVTLAPGKHEVRVELKRKAADQEASVILAYPNFHICPWTAEELPHAATLDRVSYKSVSDLNAVQQG